MSNTEPATVTEPVATPLLAPRHGLPDLVTTETGLRDVVSQLAQGSGPIAIDAERASGYRYSQRAYLIQIYRVGGGLHLIDPIAIGDTFLWEAMGRDFADVEWIIHASTQDLPCLRELGLKPQRLFDTELGGRIAGCARVGLGALTEQLLGLSLAKEHSAVDWSIRPLKNEWLTYAALDVDVLVELRDEVEKLLRDSGKLEWALEDFAAILQQPAKPPRQDPWRRTSGMHKVRDRLTLAIIRDMWQARDDFAAEIDLSAGRVFNDDSLVELATKRPKEINEFARILQRRSRVEKPPIERWFDVYRAALLTPPDKQPELRTPSQGLPPAKLWQTRNPLGYARLTHARAAVLELASAHNIPAENLISPDLVREICWPENTMTVDVVRAKLAELGARSWQIEIVAPALTAARLEREPLVVPEATEPETETTAE
jgi:ribonuclease D